MHRPRLVIQVVAANIGLLLVLLALVELGLRSVLHAPTLLGTGRLRDVARQLYIQELNIIQLMPQCSQYDSELTYRLRPGMCLFSNIEYSDTFRINSAGVRDDERSLHAPEIIMIGDSYTMGWGVRHDESFPQIVEARVGKTVLDAGISSYGTAREVMSLSRYDTSRLKTLVIQYCDNDLAENDAFAAHHNSLPVMSRAGYDSLVRQQQGGRGYYFGKYVITLLKSGFYDRLVVRVRRALGWAPSSAAADVHRRGKYREAELFLNVLANSPVPLDRVRILVLQLNAYDNNDGEFLQMLHAVADSEPRFAAFRRIETLDLSPLLTDRDYYTLDPHISSRGQRIVAAALLRALAKRPGSGAP